MNLKQAMVMMSLGLKVTKSSWYRHEYVYLKNGEVWDENHNGSVWDSLSEFYADHILEDSPDAWTLFDKPVGKTDEELFNLETGQSNDGSGL